MVAHTSNLPDGMEQGLDAVDYYDPPNMTFPFGAYVCVVDIDKLHRRDQGAALLRARRLRHAHQPDDHRGPDPWRPDRGVRGGDGPADPLRRERQPPGQQPDGLLPADRGGDAALGDRPHGHALPAPSDRRQGRGRSPHVGGIPCFSNAVIDAFAHLGVTHMDMPHTPTASGSSATRWASASEMIDRAALARAFGDAGYVADAELATARGDDARSCSRPLLLEGEAGVGKTEVAKVLAAVARHPADPPAVLRGAGRQRRRSTSGTTSASCSRSSCMKGEQATLAEKERHFSDRSFLLERPLLRAITQDRPPVLLIDEIDRADEEFEAYLLELLADFQVSVPELGTITAHQHPLGGADPQRHARALRRAAPPLPLPLHRLPGRGQGDAHPDLARCRGSTPALARQIARFVQAVRREDLKKKPGVAETLDWAARPGRPGRPRPARRSGDHPADPALPAQDPRGHSRACRASGSSGCWPRSPDAGAG